MQGSWELWRESRSSGCFLELGEVQELRGRRGRNKMVRWLILIGVLTSTYEIGHGEFEPAVLIFHETVQT